MEAPSENNALVAAETQPDFETPQPNKRRKKKSLVWEYFTIENVGAGCRRACCKQCKQSFAYSTGSKVAGTSHLKRHIAKGTCLDKNQLTPFSAPSKMGPTDHTPKRRYRMSGSAYFSFDPDRCRHEIARTIIMHDYPLHMVEHPGFVAFAQTLQPRFDMVSFNSIQGDCVATYLREKQSLQKVIEGMPGRVCLALDLWTSRQSIGYVFLTGQFIDSDWKLHRKILNVVMEPSPESDSALSHAVAVCLSDWSMEGRLFSLTINQPLSETGIDNLRALLSVKNPLMLNGQLLLGNCLARTLSSIAEEAFTAAHNTVKKIRDSVKYVKTSESHEEKFLEIKQQLQVPSAKSLALDDQTRWNTTYEMLLAASELKEVFSCLDTYDPDYKEAPSMEDWKQVETLCIYLKLLFDPANLLTGTTVPTTDVFFHEMWKTQLELLRAASSEDPFVSSLTKPMQEKFDKYWKNCCLILAIAVVMDPRFKTKLVEFSFSKIYGDDAATYITMVDEGIHELFLEYVALPLPLTPTFVDEANGVTVKAEDTQVGTHLSDDGLGLTDFDVYIMETTSQQERSELDQYLEESLLPRVHEFDVIGWWKLNKLKYPTLSKMAWGCGFLNKPSPIPERFFLGGNSSPVSTLGGPTTLLGFKARGLGPTEPRRQIKEKPNEEGSETYSGRDYIGGDLALTAFADLSFDLPLRVFRDAGIHGHVFACAGNLTKLTENAFRDLSFQKFRDSFRSSAGFGIIVPTKLFRMEVNYCYLLKQLEHDRGKTGVQFSFSSPL